MIRIFSTPSLASAFFSIDSVESLPSTLATQPTTVFSNTRSEVKSEGPSTLSVSNSVSNSNKVTIVNERQPAASHNQTTR